MACVLATPGSVPLLAETHAGSLLTCWLGFCQVGLEPFPVLTHWATTTNFMGLLPLPRFRAYLGATSAWFGVARVVSPDVQCPAGQEPGQRSAYGCPRSQLVKPRFRLRRHALIRFVKASGIA